MKIIHLLCLAVILSSITLYSAPQNGSGTGTEKKYTVNTDPLVMALGVYYLTLDYRFADHFIWGNAAIYRNGNMCAVSRMRDDIWGIGYSAGIAYFPFDPEAKGFHLAGFMTSMAMFDGDRTYFSPTPGGYLGYSFHFYNTVKLSFKLGAMYTFEENFSSFPEGGVYPHMSLEIGYMF